MLTLNDGRNELWQWDTGRTLAVDADCSQVHFSNKVFGRSNDVDVIDGIAIIPDILLQTDKDLTAWAFVGTAENGYTKISKTFKVNKRNKPADYVFTPPEQTTLEEIKEKLDYLESIQDPDAIKNAVDEYLANNPIQIDEKDPTVPDWAKQTTKPKYTATEVGAVAKVNGVKPDANGNVEITIPDSGGNVDQSGGLSATATTLLISILRNAVYSTDQSANIDALKTALESGAGGGDSGGDDGGDAGGSEVTNYTVTNALTNVTTSNEATSVASGSYYSATLTALDGFAIEEVAVLMGNVDITSTAYSDGVITIESVTGNIVIAASAVSVNVKTLHDYDYSELADYYTCTFNGEGVYPSITLQNPSAMWAAWTVEDEYLKEFLSNETITLIAAHDQYGFNGGNKSTKISGGGTYGITPMVKETIYTDDAGNMYSYMTWSIEDIKAAINANKTCKMEFKFGSDNLSYYHGVFGMILHNVPGGVVTQEMLLNTIKGV